MSTDERRRSEERIYQFDESIFRPRTEDRMTMALLSSLKLYTRIDAMGVHFRMKPFHFKEQTIPWEDIDQIHVRKYSPILEYGGWGMRYGRNGKAFNVRGNYGIQIVKKNGKKVLIGTQRPEDAARQLSVHPLLV